MPKKIVEKTQKKKEILYLLLFSFFAALLSLTFRTTYFLSTILFYWIPAIWLSLRTKQHVTKALVFSLIFSLPLGFIIDYIAILDEAWFVPTTIFPVQFLGVVSIEEIFWGFSLIYYIILYYIHFYDREKRGVLNKRMRGLIFLLVTLLAGFFSLFYVRKDLLVIPYAYFWIGTLFLLLPTVFFLVRYPKLLPKYFKTAVFFFFLAVLFEFTGLELQHWTFPGSNFIGWVTFFGNKMPVEEFFFWFVVGTTGILSYYEFFDDDRK
jgi:hypothetical protein